MSTTEAAWTLWIMQISDAIIPQKNTTHRCFVSARSIRQIATGPMKLWQAPTHTHSLPLLLQTEAEHRSDQVPRTVSHRKIFTMSFQSRNGE
jgi:hypothetical protein